MLDLNEDGKTYSVDAGFWLIEKVVEGVPMWLCISGTVSDGELVQYTLNWTAHACLALSFSSKADAELYAKYSGITADIKIYGHGFFDNTK